MQIPQMCSLKMRPEWVFFATAGRHGDRSVPLEGFVRLHAQRWQRDSILEYLNCEIPQAPWSLSGVRNTAWREKGRLGLGYPDPKG